MGQGSALWYSQIQPESSGVNFIWVSLGPKGVGRVVKRKFLCLCQDLNPGCSGQRYLSYTAIKTMCAWLLQVFQTSSIDWDRLLEITGNTDTVVTSLNHTLMSLILKLGVNHKTRQGQNLKKSGILQKNLACSWRKHHLVILQVMNHLHYKNNQQALLPQGYTWISFMHGSFSTELCHCFQVQCPKWKWVILPQHGHLSVLCKLVNSFKLIVQ